jgi:hypothetical protein
VQRRAEVLAPVRGDQQQPLPRGGPELRRIDPLRGPQQRVDDGVARDVHAVAGRAFADQVVGGALRRREVQRRQARHQQAVHLLRERLAQIARAQPRFDVRERYVAVEAAQCGDHHGGGVALCEHQCRRLLGEDRVEGRDHPRGEVRERLAGTHQVEVAVGPHTEEGVDLIEHLAVLRRRQHTDAQVAAGGQRAHHGRHLHRLGPGSDHAQHGRRRAAPGR